MYKIYYAKQYFKITYLIYSKTGGTLDCMAFQSFNIEVKQKCEKMSRYTAAVKSKITCHYLYRVRIPLHSQCFTKKTLA